MDFTISAGNFQFFLLPAIGFVLLVALFINAINKIGSLQQDLKETRNKVDHLASQLDKQNNSSKKERNSCLFTIVKFLITYVVPALIFPHDPGSGIIVFLVGGFGSLYLSFE